MIPAPHPFPVVVPEGKKAGDEVTFLGPDDKERKARVPEGYIEGQTFNAIVYPSNSVEVKVTVPEGLVEGQDFQFKSPLGMLFSSKVPEGKKGGDEVVVRIPRGA